MSKLTIVVSAVVVAGCASTQEWRALRIDGSSQAGFESSVSLIQREMPTTRRRFFDLALADIWVTGRMDANVAASGDFTAEDYFRQLDGLDYEGVIELADSAGPSISRQYAQDRAARVQNLRRSAPGVTNSGWTAVQSSGFTNGPLNGGAQPIDAFDPPSTRGF
jgi:hypothetical protein